MIWEKAMVKSRGRPQQPWYRNRKNMGKYIEWKKRVWATKGCSFIGCQLEGNSDRLQTI